MNSEVWKCNFENFVFGNICQFVSKKVVPTCLGMDKEMDVASFVSMVEAPCQDPRNEKVQNSDSEPMKTGTSYSNNIVREGNFHAFFKNFANTA